MVQGRIASVELAVGDDSHSYKTASLHEVVETACKFAEHRRC